jgi:hypothetical protein
LYCTTPVGDRGTHVRRKAKGECVDSSSGGEGAEGGKKEESQEMGEGCGGEGKGPGTDAVSVKESLTGMKLAESGVSHWYRRIIPWREVREEGGGGGVRCVTHPPAIARDPFVSEGDPLLGSVTLCPPLALPIPALPMLQIQPQEQVVPRRHTRHDLHLQILLISRGSLSRMAIFPEGDQDRGVVLAGMVQQLRHQGTRLVAWEGQGMQRRVERWSLRRGRAEGGRGAAAIGEGLVLRREEEGEQRGEEDGRVHDPDEEEGCEVGSKEGGEGCQGWERAWGRGR